VERGFSGDFRASFACRDRDIHVLGFASMAPTSFFHWSSFSRIALTFS
jgi:hypothetical protein